MFIKVKLLRGFTKPLWYSVPDHLLQKCSLGTIVRVPLRKKIVSAVIEQMTDKKPQLSFALRDIDSLEQLPHDTTYMTFILKLAQYYQINYIALLKRLQIFIKQPEKEKPLFIENVILEKSNSYTVALTYEQQKIADTIIPSIHHAQYKPILLHGVTGSGKTEIYKQIIIEAIKNNKSVVLLLPEVTLAVQFERLLREQLPSTILLYGFHSATGIQQKRQLWHHLLTGNPVLIIGVHLPILLPIGNLGCIIVDEEHEIGYQEKRHPKINSKEAAILRADISKIPIVLGSGTPSITSLYGVQHKGWQYAQLTQRFAGTFPNIEIVSLVDKKIRRNFWISTKLELALKEQLQQGKQSIIFLNRRGYSFFVQCKKCAFVIMCSHCSVSLTLHENNLLTCHYCSMYMLLPTHCAECKQDKDPFIKKGIGTQQVVSILQKRFPTAIIARADLDATINKKKWQHTMEAMRNGTIDILIGTQTITKGYHFPNVTLVGILWADLNLHFPFYNAAETTLQQLIQVAGRAGRSSSYSRVIVQTMIDHPIYAYFSENTYRQFYDYELLKRKILNYPPYMRFAEIELRNSDEKQVDNDAQQIASFLSEQIKKNNVFLLGPAKPPVAKIKNIHIRKIYLKASSIDVIHTLYQNIEQKKIFSKIFFTPNPLA